MEKYKLGNNIILTTIERYEKEFKALGYEPYKESKVEEKTGKEEEKAVRRKRREE